jgi:RNA polymerase sigma-70 factor (ECF subfamily)
VADAEDVVQDAWLRWSRVDMRQVADPRAFLIRITTRLALDRLRRIKARREEYVGPWLPEPLLTRQDIAEDVALAESISMALLVVLETLSPLERAVFVLREAFDLPHSEIGEILGRSEEAVRQVARRARQHVDERRPRFPIDLEVRRAVTQQFLTAAAGGDLNALMNILAPDVRVIADGGGKALAPRAPLEGFDKVTHFLEVSRKQGLADATTRIVEVNGGPGILIVRDGRVTHVTVLDIVDGRVQTIWLVANPDKLGFVQVR